MTIITDQHDDTTTATPPRHTRWCDVDQHELEHQEQADGHLLDEGETLPMGACAGPLHETPIGAVFLTGELGSVPTIAWLNDAFVSQGVRKSSFTLEEAAETAAVLARVARQAQHPVSLIPPPTPSRDPLPVIRPAAGDARRAGGQR